MAQLVDFNPSLHQKVRYNDQLYAIVSNHVDFNELSPTAEVVLHFVSHEKVIFLDQQQHVQFFKVRKQELIAVEPHIIE